MEVFLGTLELLAQETNGELRYRKVDVYGKGALRLNSDRTNPFTNVSNQAYTGYRIDLIFDWPLDSYECELYSEINVWNKARFYHFQPQGGRIEEVNLIFDLLFFWRSVATAAASEVATGTGILVWNIAEASFGSILSSLAEACASAVIKSCLSKSLKIVNLANPWVVDITTGVSTKLAIDKATSLISASSSTASPPMPKAVQKLNTVYAFKMYVDPPTLKGTPFSATPKK